MPEDKVFMRRNNRIRAGRAQTAIKVHKILTHTAEVEVDHETEVTDLLVDIRHYCKAAKLDFKDLLDASRSIRRAQRTDDGDPSPLVGEVPDWIPGN